MLTKQEKATLNKELKALLDEYQQRYESQRQASEAKYKTSLKAGETFHEQKGFYYDRDRQTFNNFCEHLKERAHKLIDKAAMEVMAQNTAAPSTEAVNVVTLVNSRQNVPVDEIDQLMTKYGLTCPMVYNALKEKAESLGYRDFRPHPITEEAEGMEAMLRAIDRTFTSASAENSMVANTAAYAVTADQVFNTGE